MYTYCNTSPVNIMQSRNVIKLCKQTFSRYGIPQQLHSDNKSQFNSAKFAAFCFQHNTSSPGHQQSNGKAESAVRIIKKLMKAENPA